MMDEISQQLTPPVPSSSSDGGGGRGVGWPYLFVVLAPLILFAPFLLGRQVLYWGTPLLQFYPWRQFALETIRAGHLPLWNPYLGHGAPLMANYQSAIFYPPNWLSLLLPLDYSFSWLVALHLIWAGAGMVTLARALGLRPLGQAVAGLAFGMSQYLVARAGFFSINAAVAWLPWVIWAGDQLVANTQYREASPWDSSSRSIPLGRNPALRPALLLSLFLSLQLLAGHAQTAWYTLLLLGAWTLWRIFTPAPLHASRFTHASRFLLPSSFFLAILLAFLLAALQLLPTAELLRQSLRADAADYEFVMTYSFSPWRLLTLFAPDLLGNPAHGQFYGYGNYWEDAVYVGILPVLLAGGVIASFLVSGLRRLFALLLPSRSLPLGHSPTPSSPHPRSPAPRHLVAFLFLLLPITFLLATGRNTPVFPFFYRYVPTFNLFQAPARMMIWFVFALALLAGIGADRWSKIPFRGPPPQRWTLYWTRLGAVGAITVTITSLVVWAAVPPVGKLAQQLNTVSRAVALAGVGLFISVILFLLKPKTAAPGHPTLWELSIALFLAADLIFAGYGLNPGAPPALYRVPAASGVALSPALGGHRLFQFPGDEYHVKFDLLFSFKTFGPPERARAAREAELPNVAQLDGLASANNFDPLVSARYAGLVRVISDTHSLTLLPLMDVAAVVSSVPLDLDVIARGDATTLYRVPGDVRRVRVVYAARTVADADAALTAVAAPDFDPAATVILEAGDPGVYPHTPAPPHVSLTASPNAVTIPVSLRQSGWVVLSDTYYPGWFVFVDGQPATLLHADYAFRAVAVEAGDHVVEFRYEPRPFQIGLWISAVSGVIWLGLALWLWRRKPAPGGP